MSLAVTIGVGIIALVLLAYSSLISSEKHGVLKNFIMMIILPLLLIIPASLMLEQQDCTTQVTNTTVTGNTTAYAYGDVCYSHNNGSTMLLKVYSVILILMMFYIIIKYVGELLTGLTKLVKKV
jgi:hypothetical protein